MARSSVSFYFLLLLDEETAIERQINKYRAILDKYEEETRR